MALSKTVTPPEKPGATPAATTIDIPAKSKRRSRILLAVCIAGGLVFKLSFVFFAIGMLPAMVAYIVDHDRNKYIFSTVAALNLAGVFPYTMEIFMRGGTIPVVKEKLSDMMVWLTMYSAAGLGWALVWMSPLIAATALTAIYQGRILHMESMQKKLEEEWGAEITGKTPKS